MIHFATPALLTVTSRITLPPISALPEYTFVPADAAAGSASPSVSASTAVIDVLRTVHIRSSLRPEITAPRDDPHSATA